MSLTYILRSGTALIPLLFGLPSVAQTMSPSINMFGTTGLIDMPSGESQPDAEWVTTISSFSDFTKGSFTFQFLPRFSGTFRYSYLDNWNIAAGELYDRSFDFQFRFLDEAQIRPSVSIGLRDFMGTGIYSSQYLVATKNIGSKFKVTGGLGWGRLNNEDTAAAIDFGQGGVPNFSEWFNGTPAPFGGIEWQTPLKNVRFKAEYSSDKYVRENRVDGVRTAPSFERNSPLNFGLEYRTPKGVQVGLYYLYGDKVGLSFTTALNPKRWAGVVDRAPIPIAHRPANRDLSTGWTELEGIGMKAEEQLNTILNKDGIRAEMVRFSGTSAELRFRNGKYFAVAQAMGRAARAMAHVFPDSVEEFVLVPVVKGIPLSQTKIMRSDLERLENTADAAGELAKLVDVSDAHPVPIGADMADGLYPNFGWSLRPFASIKLFDSQDPFAITAGLRLKADYNISPGFSLNGSVIKKLLNPITTPSPSPSNLPPVRTDIQRYNNEGDPAIEYLTANYMFKISPSTYGRVTTGFLERMYGGVSAEVLWKPAEKNWGLGAEVNAVRQRGFDQLLSFRDYETVTGHVSGYLSFKNGYDFQLDVGRYLAGDFGATLSVDRTFDNGWKVGAYATLTDVPFEDFGEGSFDKGIRLEIPIGWALGTPSKRTASNELASLTRDGGARLNVQNRLYDVVDDGHANALSGSWGRFWK